MKWVLSRRKFIFSTLLGSPGLLAADACLIEPHWVKTRFLRIGAGTPTHRVVHFTDLHHKGDVVYLEKIVEQINELSPDLVCFTGDLVEESKHVSGALAVLKMVKSPMYGVPGNHDYWAKANFGEFKNCFAGTGGAFLLDEQVTTGDGKIHIAGASCSKWRDSKGLKFPPPKADGKNIMLIHYPAFVESLDPHKYDLILAGHSHGGQVRIPFYGPLITISGTKDYDLGLFQTPAGPMYVNPGLGWFYTPIRFNCRPEITVFEI